MSAPPRKQEKDYTAEVDALVPEATKLAESGQLQEAVDKLLALEKQTRNAADLSSTSKILVLIPTLAYKQHDLVLVNSTVVLLAKRHGQLKEAVVKMVDAVMAFLPEIKEKNGIDKWLELLNTLRSVTDGKIYLELPRARLTTLLSRHHEKLAETAPAPPPEASTSTTDKTTKEKEADAKAEPVTSKDHRDRAADLLSELQVETYSSMERREKTEFILDQMRLESQRGNWVRVRVGSRKINRAYLKEDGNSDLKLRYFDLVIKLALQEDDYLDACKSYQEVYDTEEVKEDEARAKEALENIAYFVILAPHNNEQSDMLHKVFRDSAFEKVPLQYDLLKSFTTQELMRWPGIETLYGPTLRQATVFQPASASPTSSSKGDTRWEALHSRVIEHNIRVVSAYYTRITLPRLSQLLDLSQPRTEEVLCKLVVDKTVWARIDRPAGIVDFRRKKASDEVLTDWSSNLGKMLSLIEKTSHLINKEYAVHAAKVVSA